MIATLPPPPQKYSFDCPSCHSMLSIPVEMEGITGPCPYCQQTVSAPPLLQSREYAEYYHAHEQAYLQQQQQEAHQRAYAEQQQYYATQQAYAAAAPAEAPSWSQPTSFQAPEAAAWTPPQPVWEAETPAPYEPVHAPLSWQDLVGPDVAPAAMPAAFPVAHAPAPLPAIAPMAPKSLPPHSTSKPNQRPLLLKLGLGLGILGLGIGTYVTLKPAAPPQQVNYQPAIHVPLTPEQAAALATQPAPPPVNASPAEQPPQPNEAPAETPAENVPVATPARPASNPPPLATVPPRALPANPPIPKIVTEDTPELEQPGLLDEPKAALKAFLAANNWTERARFTQHADALRKEMKEYYADHADGPIRSDAIDYLTSQPTPDGKGRFHLFQVECGEKFGFPVSVESMGSGFKVDWRSFVEFKDLKLPKYFETYSSEPATFHVVLRRSHYFGTDIPDPDSKVCFTVEPPVTGYENQVWVDKSSTEILSKLGPRADFGYISYPVVSLRWVKEKGGAAYVTLHQVVADNWRTDATLPSGSR